MVCLPWPHTQFIHISFDTQLNCALVKRSANSAKHSLPHNCSSSGTAVHFSLFADCNNAMAGNGSCILSVSSSWLCVQYFFTHYRELSVFWEKYDLIVEPIKFTRGQKRSAFKYPWTTVMSFVRL